MAKTLKSPLTQRDAHAVHLRDAALRKIRAEGHFEPTSIGPVLVWRGSDLSILHRTPFQKLPPVSESLKYFGALVSAPCGNLSYGLDIWDKLAGPKVFNIEWDDGGDIVLVTFQRGDWAQRVLDLELLGVPI